MLIIDIKQGESIERALKRYKQKVRRVKQSQQLKENQHFVKKSIARREEISKAKHKEYIKRLSENI